MVEHYHYHYQGRVNRLMWFAACLLLLVGIMVLYLTKANQEHYEVQQLQKYCRMVTTYHRTQGERGWPDFKNIYDEECLINEDKSDNSKQ